MTLKVNTFDEGIGFSVNAETGVRESKSPDVFRGLSPYGHIGSSQATLYVGGAAIGFVKNLTINDNSGNTQLFEIGSPVATDIVSGKYSVDVSGSFVLSKNNKLIEGNFIPKTPQELMAQSMAGVAFDIEIGIFGIAAAGGAKAAKAAGQSYNGFNDSFSDNSGSFERSSDEFIKVIGCRCTNVGSTINASAVIECTFKAVGQLLKKTPAINITTTGFYKDFASWTSNWTT